jgi:acyl-CoA synthetase (AMP-forming)/AMP-acid ligase II
VSDSTTHPVVSRELLGSDPPHPTMGALVAAAAARFGQRELFRFGDHSMSFAEVDDYTSRLAGLLIAHGIRKGDRVAIMMGNEVGWPLTWLSILKAGAVSVSVNAAYRDADLRFILEDSGASIVVTTRAYRDLVASVRATCPKLREVWTLDDVEAELTAAAGQTLTGAADAAAGPEICSEDLASLQYTSGTTGFPKACMLPHDYWVRAGWLIAGSVELRAGDVFLTAQPFSYIDPQWNTAMCLTAGVPLVVLDRFSASGFWPSVREHGVTVFYVLGAMPLLLLKQPPSELDRQNRVRLVLCSGIVPELHRELEERWGAPWREGYGMSESGVDLLVPPDAAETVGTGAIGRPVPTKEMRILSADGAILLDGEHGEIAIHGRPMMLGYWNQPEATARTLRDGWLHTGDLGYRDSDGWFHIVGRLKDMVRRSGENISCAEVENVLGQHPSVLMAALVPVPDEIFGEEPKAFIQLRDPASPTADTAEEIAAFARARLARFKVPRYIEFVERFPLTPSERIAKQELLKAKADQTVGAYDAREHAWG